MKTNKKLIENFKNQKVDLNMSLLEGGAEYTVGRRLVAPYATVYVTDVHSQTGGGTVYDPIPCDATQYNDRGNG